MFVFVMLGLWAVMIVGANTPAGRSLRYWCIEKPAARLNRIRSDQIALVVILVAVAGIIFWAGGREAVAVLQMGMPELAGWITTFEIATYLDVGLAVLMTVTTVRFGMARRFIQSAVSHRSRRPRSRRVKRATRAANDDADPAPYLLVA